MLEPHLIKPQIKDVVAQPLIHELVESLFPGGTESSVNPLPATRLWHIVDELLRSPAGELLPLEERLS